MYLEKNSVLYKTKNVNITDIISTNILQFILREEGVKRFELPERDPFPYHRKTKKYNRHIYKQI
jgi:hypothetical protein